MPHPAAVDLAGPVAGLPRRPVRVFEGRDEALGVLERALTARGGAVVTQAVYGLGGVGKSELALQYAERPPAATTAWCGGSPRPMPGRWRLGWPGWPGGCARWWRWRARPRMRPGGRRVAAGP